jgi:hypothetical protein
MGCSVSIQPVDSSSSSIAVDPNLQQFRDFNTAAIISGKGLTPTSVNNKEEESKSNVYNSNTRSATPTTHKRINSNRITQFLKGYSSQSQHQSSAPAGGGIPTAKTSILWNHYHSILNKHKSIHFLLSSVPAFKSVTKQILTYLCHPNSYSYLLTVHNSYFRVWDESSRLVHTFPPIKSKKNQQKRKASKVETEETCFYLDGDELIHSLQIVSNSSAAYAVTTIQGGYIRVYSLLTGLCVQYWTAHTDDLTFSIQSDQCECEEILVSSVDGSIAVFHNHAHQKYYEGTEIPRSNVQLSPPSYEAKHVRLEQIQILPAVGETQNSSFCFLNSFVDYEIDERNPLRTQLLIVAKTSGLMTVYERTTISANSCFHTKCECKNHWKLNYTLDNAHFRGIHSMKTLKMATTKQFSSRLQSNEQECLITAGHDNYIRIWKLYSSASHCIVEIYHPTAKALINIPLEKHLLQKQFADSIQASCAFGLVSLAGVIQIWQFHKLQGSVKNLPIMGHRNFDSSEIDGKYQQEFPRYSHVTYTADNYYVRQWINPSRFIQTQTTTWLNEDSHLNFKCLVRNRPMATLQVNSTNSDNENYSNSNKHVASTIQLSLLSTFNHELAHLHLCFDAQDSQLDCEFNKNWRCNTTSYLTSNNFGVPRSQMYESRHYLDALNTYDQFSLAANLRVDTSFTPILPRRNNLPNSNSKANP